MKLIEPRRSTKWLDRGVLYEVVSKEDNFGYYKVREPNRVGGATRFIHKSNMREVKIV